jgi:hypothetical protein
MFLDRFDAATRALQRAGTQLDPPALVLGYYIAMLEHDEPAMERLRTRIKESSTPSLLSHAQALAAARTGELRRARLLTRQAVDAADGLGQPETAAACAAAAAVWESTPWLQGAHPAR